MTGGLTTISEFLPFSCMLEIVQTLFKKNQMFLGQ